MKKMLLKPQREASYAVFAYEDEDDDTEVTFIFRRFHNYYCDLYSANCAFEQDAGNCTQVVKAGDGYEIRFCL